MGGTQLRNMIAAKQESKFLSKLPPHLSDKEKQDAWNTVAMFSNESLNNIIDNQLEEMSTMSSGAVQGATHPSGFGPSNRYNPYKRGKTKKPTVKRAKRQRRR